MQNGYYKRALVCRAFNTGSILSSNNFISFLFSRYLSDQNGPVIYFYLVAGWRHIIKIIPLRISPEFALKTK
jgi:hypothetical protein